MRFRERGVRQGRGNRFLNIGAPAFPGSPYTWSNVQRGRVRPFSQPAQRRGPVWCQRHGGSDKSGLRRRVAAFGAGGGRANCRSAIQDPGLRGGHCVEFSTNRTTHRQDNLAGENGYASRDFQGPGRAAAGHIPCGATLWRCAGCASFQVGLSTQGSAGRAADVSRGVRALS